MFDIFMIEGWLLPVKNTFTYTYKEKSLLYKYFIEGEGTGKSLSPQAIHNLLRKTVQSYEYFTTQQFCSLYSIWLKEMPQGKPKQPVAERSNRVQW